MIHRDIDIEAVIEITHQIPPIPWFYVLYAYIISTLRKNGGNRTWTSRQIRMPLRSLKYKFAAMEVLGFEVPKGRIGARKKVTA